MIWFIPRFGKSVIKILHQKHDWLYFQYTCHLCICVSFIPHIRFTYYEKLFLSKTRSAVEENNWGEKEIWTCLKPMQWYSKIFSRPSHYCVKKVWLSKNFIITWILTTEQSNWKQSRTIQYSIMWSVMSPSYRDFPHEENSKCLIIVNSDLIKTYLTSRLAFHRTPLN